MKTSLLNGLVKAAPFAMAAFSVMLFAHGVHIHGISNGDPGGSGGPNLHMKVFGDPGGSGGPN